METELKWLHLSNWYTVESGLAPPSLTFEGSSRLAHLFPEWSTWLCYGCCHLFWKRIIFLIWRWVFLSFILCCTPQNKYTAGKGCCCGRTVSILQCPMGQSAHQSRCALTRNHIRSGPSEQEAFHGRSALYNWQRHRAHGRLSHQKCFSRARHSRLFWGLCHGQPSYFHEACHFSSKKTNSQNTE